MWNPLPKMGRYGIHCPKRVFMESTAQNGSMWNPLPKLGLMLFTLEDTPNLALLKLEFERQAMGSVNIHFASNLFCWGRLVSILEKKRLHVKNGKVQDGIHCPNWVWYYLSWRMPEKFLFHTVDTKSMWMTVLKFQNFFFHSIFAFYMNSILVILKTQKLPFCFLTILVDLNVVLFGIFFDISKCKIPQKSKCKASKIVEMAVCDHLKSAKIDFA